MNWLSNIQIYIDQGLKAHDKEFVNRCEQMFADYKLSLCSEIKNLQLSELPNILILFNNYESERYTIKDNDVVIQYKKPNLDFFTRIEEHITSYEVDSILQLNDVWEFVSEYLSSSIFQLEKKYYKLSAANSKKVFTRNNMSKLVNGFKKKEFSAFESDLYLLEGVEDSYLLVSNFFKEVLFESGYLCNLSEFLRIKEEYKYLAIEFIEGHFIFLCWKGADEGVFKLYTILTDYYAHFNSTHEINLMSQNWEQIIDLVQIPIVLIGDSDQALVHNRAFSNLNYPINKCLKLNDNDQITIDKNLYRVIVNQNRKEKPVYLFFPVDEFLVTKNKPSTEQLGIVSSSIAHELNNPLAGILAGIDVLGLEDIDEEYQEKLMEMKKGVLRCKNLVETFLGFSRIETSYAYQNNLTFEFQESIQQALDLIRFRLIENNILMDLKYEKRAKFLQKLNPYIISMLFYLIFGELITNFSHYNLVKRESSFKIDLVVEENGRSISLSMPKDVALSDKFLNSKLFIHLREVERLKFKQENSIFSLMFSS